MKRSLPPLPRFALCLFVVFAPLAAQAASSAADQKNLAEALSMYNKGAYAQAVEKAQAIHSTDRESTASVALFLGSAYSKMQAFDKAAASYALALKNGSKAAGIHYDYGQALFAMQQLKEAEEEFRKSIIAKFKMGTSAYYIGYIRSVLDDKKGARDFYERIQKLSTDPDKVKQSSLLQIAELAFEDATVMKSDPNLKQKRKMLLVQEVLPLYRRARDYSPETAVAEQAKARITEVEAQLEEMVERMRNGNPLPRQAYTLLLSQDFTYDSNVITEADQALVQVSNKDALIWKSGFMAKYQFSWLNTFSFIPELASSITYHSRRSTPSVYQNDNISLSPALRTKLEHWSGGKPATLQLDLEFNLLLRDYLKQHQYPFYTRYYNVALSERVKWFDTGNSTLKVSLKLLEYYDPSKNSYSPMVSFTQLVKLSDAYNLVNTVSADYLHSRDDQNDERNYKYRGSIAFTQLIEKIDVTPAFAIGLKDTMKQRITRGNETNISPSVALNRPLGKHVDGTLEYTYTKNISKSLDTYQYAKHEVHAGFGYNF